MKRENYLTYLFGQEVYVIEATQGRSPFKSKERGFTYYVRHSDECGATPAEINNRGVLVNYFGKLLLDRPLNEVEENSVAYLDDEQSSFVLDAFLSAFNS